MQLRDVLESLDRISDGHTRRQKLKMVLEEGIRLRAEVDSIDDHSSSV
jgi:hypothetical protein